PSPSQVRVFTSGLSSQIVSGRETLRPLPLEGRGRRNHRSCRRSKHPLPLRWEGQAHHEVDERAEAQGESRSLGIPDSIKTLSRAIADLTVNLSNHEVGSPDDLTRSTPIPPAAPACPARS